MITPTPWEAQGDIVRSNADIDGNIVCLAPTSWLKASLEHWPDNARLIAAAPTQHALLIEAIDLVPRMSDDDPIAPALADWCRRVRAAIQEATA